MGMSFSNKGESSGGPRNQTEATALGQFVKTKNGSKLYDRLKQLDKEIQTAQHAENEAKKKLAEVENKIKQDNPYYNPSPQQQAQIDAGRKAVFDTESEHSALQNTRYALWLSIENTLHHWPSICKLPLMILQARKQLDSLKPELEENHNKRNYARCLELDERKRELERGIESWTSNWTVATGDPVPEAPEVSLKELLIMPFDKKRSIVHLA